MQEAANNFPRLLWLPGSAKRAVMEAGRRIRAAGFHCPEDEFFEKLAERAEEFCDTQFGEIDCSDPSQEQHVANHINKINRWAMTGPDDMFAAAEFAEIPAETMLGCWLAMFGTFGYGDISLEVAWNSRPDPEWGTLWCPKAPIGDHRPDFVFKVCYEREYRVLAVECEVHPILARKPRPSGRGGSAPGRPRIRLTSAPQRSTLFP